MAFDFGSLVSPVLSIAGGLFGQSRAQDAANSAAELQFERQKDLMRLQHDFQVDDYRNRYNWTVSDMKRAGLNPILAATQGIGGNISGVSSGAASMAQTPMVDFSHIGEAFNSARSISNQKEIAKMQNQVAKEDLHLKSLDINSAVEKRQNDITLDNARYDLEKMVQEAAVKRADELNSATIQNMKDRLKADIEHFERMDLNGAAMASAAMASANAAGLQAAVAAELGISKQEVMAAEKAYIGLQSQNAEETLKWQEWLNDHPYTRGCVGFLGALFDTVGLAKGMKNLGNSIGDMVD